MANNTSIGDLHEVLITQILLRLPVNSMLVCKSVCKPWRSIISTPHFINSQLLRAITASMTTPMLLVIRNPIPTDITLASFYELEEFRIKNTETSATQYYLDRLVDPADLSLSPVLISRLIVPRLFFPDFGVKGCCNGIICLANSFGDDIYLWNPSPSIRMCKKLPVPNPYTSRFLPVKIGFGYDSISNGYKVFRIVCIKKYGRIPIVQVYSTITNYWREFRDPILKNYEHYRGRTNIVVNGVLYFDGKDELISFDLHTEVFGRVPLPKFLRKRSNLLDFEGSVAMVFETGQDMFDLWTLHDVSGQLSWTKTFGIDADIWLIEYLGAGQFYAKEEMGATGLYLYYILYDYLKKERKFYECTGAPNYAVLKYTETLVSPVGFWYVV